MQVAPKRNLPKRSRYYQGMIDLNSIEKGAKYNALKKSFIIFICMFDPFNEDLPIINSKSCLHNSKLFSNTLQKMKLSVNFSSL